MNPHLLLSLVKSEVLLRTRRLSTLFALLAVVALCWAMIPDPASGMTMMAIKHTRVLYSSSMLAACTAMLSSLLFSLIGFYLVRGRMAEDARSGIGSVIGATPVGNFSFIFGRWLGGVAYMLVLVVGFLGTTLLCHFLRSDQPIELSVYVFTYALILMPMIFFAVSCATLFDSIPILMGKAGDVLYFILWVAQMSLMSKIESAISGQFSPAFLLDFTGMALTAVDLKANLGTNHFSIGVSDFDPRLTPMLLPTLLWSSNMIWMRATSACAALLPLLPAAWLFHRYSPDRVKLSHTRNRRTPLAVLNDWLRPLAKLVQPLFGLAARTPGFAGKVIADVALTLVTSPSAIAVLALGLLASLLSRDHGQGPSGPLLPLIVFWGVFISDLATRDFQANTEALTGAVPGGASARFWRQFASSLVLGLMFTGIMLLRLAFIHPLLAAALLTGLVSFSALATMLGRTSRTSRTFVSLFLFWVYLALNTPKAPLLDVAGFNGSVTLGAMTQHGMIALLALAIGAGYTMFKAR